MAVAGSSSDDVPSTQLLDTLGEELVLGVTVTELTVHPPPPAPHPVANRCTGPPLHNVHTCGRMNTLVFMTQLSVYPYSWLHTLSSQDR